jgi:hypothetical protein
MEPTREQSSQPPLTLELTLDMIKPTPDNQIPPNGIFPEIDPELGRLYKNFRDNPNDPTVRLEYLKYIATRGDKDSVMTYLSMIKLPEYPELSGELRLEETRLLADLFMNAAEAARRRNEYWKRNGRIGTENPLEYLELSLKYQQEAERLRKKLEEKEQLK